ncbi:MAG TPA: hypothetical protein VNL15_02010 [Dehalococcoidia bacterium]|nr:hypothetical protein [Dehalococcoidia bacterium]
MWISTAPGWAQPLQERRSAVDKSVEAHAKGMAKLSRGGSIFIARDGGLQTCQLVNLTGETRGGTDA